MNTQNVLACIKNLIRDPSLLEVSRTKKGAFTRRRVGGMGFSEALCFMLDMRKTTIQSRLNHFFRRILGGAPITQQAFSKLRDNFDHTPFATLMRELVQKEYSGDSALPTWRDYHLLAADGSYLQLPWSTELAEKFGVRGGGDRPNAGISVIFDVLHGWVLEAEIDHTDRNEREALSRQIDALRENLPHIAARALLLLDRGYPSHEMLQKCVENSLKFVFRCSNSCFKAVNEAPMGDSIVTLSDGQTVRVVKFLLTSGDVETLVTNLFDVSADEFLDLYAMRWGVETLYFALKREACVEKFSGKSENAIRQDFWASLVVLLVGAVVQKEADEKRAQRRKGKIYKHFYHTRTSEILIALRDRFVLASLCRDSAAAVRTLDGIFSDLSRSVSAVRPGRHFPRVPRPCAAANQNLKSVL